VAADDPFEPYWLLDADGAVVSSFLRELLAASRSPLTLRSYAIDLLRWWRWDEPVDRHLGGHPARYPLRICSLMMSACPQC
jgi:hypothetical protein